MKKILLLILILSFQLFGIDIDSDYLKYINNNNNNHQHIYKKHKNNIDNFKEMEKDFHYVFIKPKGKRYINGNVEIKNFVPQKQEIKESLEKLIKEKKFQSAYDLFKTVNVDFTEQEYNDYNYYLKIVNSFDKNIDINGVKYISNKRTNQLMNDFYFILYHHYVTDENYIVKMLELVSLSNLTLDEKYRNYMKLYNLTGKMVMSLKSGLSIQNPTKEDKNYIKNLFKTLKIMETRYFKDYLETNYKNFSIQNMK